MKKKYCSHCGEELSPEEMTGLSKSLCAFCANIKFEALEIVANNRSRSPQNRRVKLTVIRPR